MAILRWMDDYKNNAIWDFRICRNDEEIFVEAKTSVSGLSISQILWMVKYNKKHTNTKFVIVIQKNLKTRFLGNKIIIQ